MVATALRVIASIGMVAILARTLPMELFATLVLGLLCGQVLAILIDGGVNNEILRFAGVESAVQHRARLDESTAVRLLMMPLPVAVVYGVSAALDNAQSAHVMALAALAGMLGALGESYFMSLRATGRYRDEISRTLLLAALMLSLPWLAYPWPAAAGLCVLLPRVFSLANLVDAPRRSLFDALYRNAAPGAVMRYYHRIRHYSLDSIVSNLGMQLDALLITLLLGKQSYALYQPTSRLFMGSLSMAPIVAGLSVPRAARMESPAQAMRFLLAVFSGSGLAVAAALLPLLLWSVGPLFGPHFQLGAPVALLLTLITLVRFVAAGSGAYLTLRGRQQHRAWINVATTAIVLPPALWLANSIETVLLAVLVSQLLLLAMYALQAYWLEPHV
jgi:O-antigen/teichoic acid export membrane protein